MKKYNDIKNSIVVFDTNVYRRIASKRNELDEIIALERKKKVSAGMSPIVSLELYYHLADFNDKEFKVCKNGIIAQYLHCKKDNGGPRIMFDFDCDLCNLLFDIVPELSRNEQEKILKMSQYLYDDSSQSALEVYIKNFRVIRDFTSDKQNVYLDLLRDVHSNIFDVNKTENDRKRNAFELRKELSVDSSINKISNFLLNRACNLLNNDISLFTEREKSEKIDLIKSQFLTSISFHRNVIKSLIDGDLYYKFNEKKANSYWDFEILHYVGNYACGKRILLVTEEKKMHTAARDALTSDSIMYLEDYKAYLRTN